MEKPSGEQNGRTLGCDGVLGRKRSSVKGGEADFCRGD